MAASLARFMPPTLPERNWPEPKETGGVAADADNGAASDSAEPSVPATAMAATLASVRLLRMFCRAERWSYSPVDGVLWLNTAGTFLILMQDEEAETVVGVDPSTRELRQVY